MIAGTRYALVAFLIPAVVLVVDRAHWVFFHADMMKGRSRHPHLDHYSLTSTRTESSVVSNPNESKTLHTASSNTNGVIDILSIGSMARPDLQQAQRTTFGSHRSVRHFFNVTEDDDADPDCLKLTTPDVLAISDFCRHNKPIKTRHRQLINYLKGPYAQKPWLLQKQNPVGWLCAQKRPIHGLYQVLQFYKQSELPDYLIVLDDDTYYNLHLFQHHTWFQNASIPWSMAGCRIQSPIRKINFTFPFGGFGLTLSKGALQRLMQPVYCQSPSLFQQGVCRRRLENLLEERPLFRPGMSVSDLMEAFVRYQPYSQYRNWTTGFCFHSDWIWGFFVNFYNISNPVDANVRESRMEAYLGSEITVGDNQASSGLCRNERDECGPTSEVCHYQTAERMAELTEQVRQLVPHEFY